MGHVIFILVGVLLVVGIIFYATAGAEEERSPKAVPRPVLRKGEKDQDRDAA